MWYILLAAVLLGLLAYDHLRLQRRVREALSKAQRAETTRGEVMNFLRRFGSSLAATVEQKRWMQDIAKYLKSVLQAENVVIYLREGDDLVRFAQFHELPPLPAGDFPPTPANSMLEHLHQERFALREGKLGEAASFNRPMRLNLAPNGPLRSLLAVPMNSDNDNWGLVCVLNKRSTQGGFTIDDAVLLESLCSQVLVGYQVILAGESLRQQAILEQQVKLARGIQTSLLPREAPVTPGVLMHGINHPAMEVSGDYFDYVPVDDGRILVVVADAAGKGMPACLLMTICHTIVRTSANRYKEDLEGFLAELNCNLRRDEGELAEPGAPSFITMGCCLLDLKDFTIEYARAGHTSMLIKFPDGNVQVITPDGPALGILPPGTPFSFDTFALSWPPGSSIMLFTDGIIEARNAEGEEFDYPRLIAAFKEQGQDPRQAIAGIMARVREFSGDAAPEDDQTIVILTRPG